MGYSSGDVLDVDESLQDRVLPFLSFNYVREEVEMSVLKYRSESFCKRAYEGVLQ